MRTTTRMPEAQAVFTIAGDPDALGWLRVRDLAHLQKTIDEILGAADPETMRPVHDSGDHLHPSDAGYAAMAAAVPLDRP